MRGIGRRIGVIAACFVIASLHGSAEESSAQLIYENGGVRDVAGSVTGESLYVSSYATDEVVEVDPATAAVKRRVKVADGPTTILVDSVGVFVLSRAAARVSILNPADLSVQSTVAVSEGTSVLFAAGTGRVGALNPFAGEVCLIDTTTESVVRTVLLEGGVPVGAAFDGERIAVVGRANSQVWFLNAETLETVATTPLPVAPRMIVSPSSGRFVVQADDRLLTLEGASPEPRSSLDVRSRNLNASRGGMLLVADGAAHLLVDDLRVFQSLALPEGADAARAIGTTVYAWSPTLGRLWRVGGSASDAVASLAPAEPVELDTQTPIAPPQETPIEVVSEPTVNVAAQPEEQPVDTPHPIAVAENEPAGEMEQLAGTVNAQLAQAIEPAPDAPTTLEPAQELAPPAEVAPTSPQSAEQEPTPAPEYRFTVQPSRLGLGGFKPYAPRFGDPTGRKFNEALAQAFAFGSDSDSILAMEPSNRIENLKFGKELRSIVSEDGGIGASASGGVEFDLSDVHVTTDSITRRSEPNELVLEGSPKLTRGESELTADRIRAFETPLPEIVGNWPIRPSQHEKPVPHPLVPRGYKDPKPRSEQPLGNVAFDNVLLSEEGRRLVADELKVNTLTRRAELTNATGQAGPLYYGAETLRITGARAGDAEDFWITTCDLPEPHYRIRFSEIASQDGESFDIRRARLQIGDATTPAYVPRYTLTPGNRGLGTEVKFGGSSELGTYVNVAQWFPVNDNLELAPRVYFTTQQGTGFGFDGSYDYMNDPASALYRAQGDLRTLYTTEQNGYTEWYHRQELTPNTVLLGQLEKWYEPDVIKEFYQDDYEDRTGPRSFLNLTFTQPEYMVTGTVAPSLHNFTRETEKLPELSFHMFERQLAGGFYGTFDAVGGYYRTEPETIDAGRATTFARLSYDWNVARGFNILPFFELDGTYYTETLDEDDDDAFRGTATIGLTAQARIQRSFPGLGNFTGFKHIIIPSATISYRPDATLDAAENPQFDALDNRPGRVRLESTLDNILLGRNFNQKVWPVARFTLYQGYDLENEAIRANDYEIDLEIRPRPAWGVRTMAEIHDVSDASELPGEDFNRVITYGFYDNVLHKNTLNGRVGFAYTEAGEGVVNEEVLYGIGYKFAKKWSAAFEHRYDFERNEFTRQTYSLRRKLHDWEVMLILRDREDSVDIGLQINLVDFPDIGTRL